MFNFIHEISGGLKLFRDKINEVIRVVNALMQLNGDETFIAVRSGHGTSGATVTLNINNVLARIPKPPPGAKLFPVNLEEDGGADGDSMTAPTWTYTVSDYYSSAVLDTEVIPNQQRPNGSTVNASSGIALYDSSGDLVIWWCDEIPNTTECSDTSPSSSGFSPSYMGT